MNALSTLAAAGVIVLVSNTAAAATTGNDRDSSPEARARADYLFPPPGDFSMSFATGIPLLAIAELDYAVRSGLAVGALAAATPDIGSMRGTAALGVRPRGILFESGPWRAVLTVPALYYPPVAGFGGDRDSWVLARPTFTLERTLRSGVRANFGLGLIAAVYTEGIFGQSAERGAPRTVTLWNTMSLGGAVPLSSRASLFAEAALVMMACGLRATGSATLPSLRSSEWPPPCDDGRNVFVVVNSRSRRLGPSA
jgi:hypothetical protein